jgi:hypothetical protein
LLYNYGINKLNRDTPACLGLDLDLSLAVLGEHLTTDTTGKLAVEDQVVILQILILGSTCIEANLRQAIAGHASLAVSHRSPASTTNLGGGTGHTAEMATFICQRISHCNSFSCHFIILNYK